MSVHTVRMPDIGEGIAEVEIVEWRVAAGDTVAEDQTLCDVMTDKAAVEVPSPVAGRVVELGGAVGQVLAVGAVLIRIEEGGEAVVHGPAEQAPATQAPVAIPPPPQAAAVSPPAAPAGAPPPSPDVPTPPPSTAPAASASRGAPLLSPDVAAPPPLAAQVASASRGAPPLSPDVPAPPPSAAPAASASPEAPPRLPDAPAQPLATMAPTPPSSPSTAPRALAAPAVRERARALGIDLSRLKGSGPDGRIVHADLDAVLSTGARTTATATGPGTGTREVRLVGLRRAIAEKMLLSKRSIPHFTYVEEVDATEMVALRDELNRRHATQRGELSPLALVIRAVVRAVRDFPQVNARFDGEAGVLTLHDAVHLGVATQTDAGLMVPVLREAQTLDLWEGARAVAALAAKARAGKATRAELTGATLTVTSLGKLGGIVSTPVINPPEVAIVGINRIVARPMVRDGTTVQVRQMMNLSSSFDHRVVDGAVAAAFIQRVKELLEAPAMLFID